MDNLKNLRVTLRFGAFSDAVKHRLWGMLHFTNGPVSQEVMQQAEGHLATLPAFESAIPGKNHKTLQFAVEDTTSSWAEQQQRVEKFIKDSFDVGRVFCI